MEERSFAHGGETGGQGGQGRDLVDAERHGRIPVAGAGHIAVADAHAEGGHRIEKKRPPGKTPAEEGQQRPHQVRGLIVEHSGCQKEDAPLPRGLHGIRPEGIENVPCQEPVPFGRRQERLPGFAEDFPYMQIAGEYENAGAAAISCLTEPYYFKGSDDYLKEIAEHVQIPVLRKDFTVDEYMIYEAKVLGASAVLLICAILTDEELVKFHKIADSLGLSALVEAHTEEEVRRAIASGARIIGVNNRDLKTFKVDINTSTRLRKLVPDDIVYVSESGIRNAEDIAALYKNNTDAVLIGETLMRAPDKKKALDELRGRVV